MPRSLVVGLVLGAALVSACGTLIGIKDLTDGTDVGADGGLGESGTGAESGGGSDGEVTPDGGREPDAADAPDGDAGIVDADCADTSQDKLNCGACGHSCLGGECALGKCQPFAIAPGQGQISDVVIDDSFVYFASYSGDVIGRVAKNGGAVTTLASGTSVHLAKRVRVNATHVYWANDDLGSGTIGRCPLSGCTGAATIIASPSDPTGLALDSAYVTWADSNATLIKRRPLDGGPEALVASPGARPIAVATAPPYTFWIEDFTGQVHRADPDGGTSLVGVSGTSGREVVATTTHVYWGSAQDFGDPGHIARAPRMGGTTNLVGEAHGEPHGLFVDTQAVYWTAWETATDGGVVDGGVYGCDLAGCAVSHVDVAVGVDHPSGVAVDGNAIYFGTKTGVMKVAR